MVYVYILKSINFNKYYTGLTTNLEQHLYEHNLGKTKSNKAYLPWEIFYTETFNTTAEARKREKYFKSGAGRVFLKNKFI